MYGRQGSSSASFVFSRNISQGLMLSLACLGLGTGYVIQTSVLPILSSDTQIQGNSLKWLSEIRIGFEQNEVRTEDPVTPAQVSSHISVVKHFPKKRVLGKVPREDRIHVTSAAPQQSHEESSSEVDATERRKLVLMHRFLTLRIMIALNASAVHPSHELLMTTHLEKPFAERSIPTLVQNTKMTTQARPKSFRNVTRSQPVRKVASRKLASLSKPVYEPAVVNIQEKVEHSVQWHQQMSGGSWEKVAVHAKPIIGPEDLEIEKTRKEVGQLSLNAARDSLDRLEEREKSPLEALNADIKMLTSDTREAVDFQPAGPSDLAPLRDTVAAMGFQYVQKNLADVSGVPQADPMSTQVLTYGQASAQGNPAPIVIVHNEYPNQAPHSQGDYSPQPAPQGPVIRHHEGQVGLHEGSGGSAANNETPSSDTNDQQASPVDDMPAFVEAFDSERRAVLGVRAKMFSNEVVGEKFERGYGYAEEEAHHWSTLDWYDPAHNGPQSVPLVNRNALELIAVQARVAGQAEHAGFIFGKIARGWKVGIAGSPEKKAVYLYANTLKDKAGNTVHQEGAVIEDAEGAIHEERYYVLMNVSPSTQWIEATSGWGEGAGALPVPVFEKTGTHIDLTQIYKNTIRGQLVGEVEKDTGDAPGFGLSIEVSEQPSARTDLMYQATNSFSIPNVVTFGNYPFYIRVRSIENPNDIYQYRVLPSKMHDVAIYPPDPRKVETWLSQIQDESRDDLEGEKRDQDLVVVALPQLVKMTESDPELVLTPRLESISSPSEVPLKAFTVYPWKQVDSPYDKVKENKPLRGRKNRFIGVKIPRGLVLASVDAETRQGNGASSGYRKKMWSELTMTWANRSMQTGGRVINIVGPY